MSEPKEVGRRGARKRVLLHGGCTACREAATRARERDRLPIISEHRYPPRRLRGSATSCPVRASTRPEGPDDSLVRWWRWRMPRADQVGRRLGVVAAAAAVRSRSKGQRRWRTATPRRHRGLKLAQVAQLAPALELLVLCPLSRRDGGGGIAWRARVDPNTAQLRRWDSLIVICAQLVRALALRIEEALARALRAASARRPRTALAPRVCVSRELAASRRRASEREQQLQSGGAGGNRTERALSIRLRQRGRARLGGLETEHGEAEATESREHAHRRERARSERADEREPRPQDGHKASAQRGRDASERKCVRGGAELEAEGQVDAARKLLRNDPAAHASERQAHAPVVHHRHRLDITQGVARRW
mmetsp:Transcript_11698/g.30489  ORF Transcript_11698/g.30489 Transcript_11698/m.30489 type:complete len:365 (+) Transcript_11698:130-1224(+)